MVCSTVQGSVNVCRKCHMLQYTFFPSLSRSIIIGSQWVWHLAQMMLIFMNFNMRYWIVLFSICHCLSGRKGGKQFGGENAFQKPIRHWWWQFSSAQPGSASQVCWGQKKTNRCHFCWFIPIGRFTRGKWPSKPRPSHLCAYVNELILDCNHFEELIK